MAESIRADGVRLRQIVLNLLSNAYKFTSEGSITVDISGRVERDTLHAVLEVRDAGIGMTNEHANRIFDAFEQADGSTTRRFGGTGLGLTITRRLAEMMGGTIEVERVPGANTTMRVRLPLPVTQAPDEAGAAPERMGEARFPDVRVLVAEDNRVN